MLSRTKDKVSERQVKILKLILKAGSQGLTRHEIKTATKIPDLMRDLGPLYKDEAPRYDTKYGHRNLVSLCYVEPVEEITTEGTTVYYRLTPIGKKAAEYYEIRDRGKYVKVPADILNNAVKGIRSNRVYGIERFTSDDLDAVRMSLPSQYVMIPLEDLRQQIVNQRKQGAYADAGKVEFNRKMSTLKKMVQLYWSEQITIDEIVSWLERKGEAG